MLKSGGEVMSDAARISESQKVDGREMWILICYDSGKAIGSD
jgi:hypothetical protein